jgi:hypothetical protein
MSEEDWIDLQRFMITNKMEWVKINGAHFNAGLRHSSDNRILLTRL